MITSIYDYCDTKWMAVAITEDILSNGWMEAWMREFNIPFTQFLAKQTWGIE